MYVNKNSNHPPAVIRNIPKSINRRLSSLSSNEEVFEKSVKLHQEALEKSGYSHKLKFDKEIHQKKSKNRSRNITYFNPPFSLNVKTKVGREFLKILDSSFPSTNPLSKLFTRNTVKISYKCMPNMKQAVSRHNNKLTRANQTVEQAQERRCNCLTQTCPVEGQCLKGPVVYRAEVTANNKIEYYTGITGNTFKERVTSHFSDFRHIEQRHSTTLSNHIWTLKENNVDYNLVWNLVEET